MKVQFYVCLLLLPFFSLHSYGDPGIYYLNGDPIAFDGVETNDAFYHFDPCEECSFEAFHGINRKDLNPKHSDEFDLHPNRKNRAADQSSKDLKYGVRSPRQEFDSVKTISFPALFTPRFGRKRYVLQPNIEMSDGRSDVTADNTMSTLGISKNAASIYLNSRNAIKPRIKSYNKKIFSHRNEFTPRLGRSSAQNLVQLSAGSAFTPRLGRSASYKQIRLNSGSVFTPRLGRSENQIHLNAGSAFTPRLGRSENQNQIHLNAGSAFTPRLGRSENQNHLNADNAFTPKLASFEGVKLEQGNAEGDFARRSEGFPSFNDENAFTPTLRTFENPNMIS